MRPFAVLTIIAIISAVAPTFAIVDQNCQDLFFGASQVRVSNVSAINAQTLIDYIGHLVHQRQISNRELALFIDGLKQGKVVNPLSKQNIFNNATALIHSQAIENLIQNIDALNIPSLLSAVETIAYGKTHEIVQTNAVRAEIHSPFAQMRFHRIPKGEFVIRGTDSEIKVSVNLSHDIEVMDAPVTQFQWAEIMGANPSYFQHGPEALDLLLKKKSVRLLPDRPVESLTWWSALFFANELSKKFGFDPAYNFDHIAFKVDQSAKRITGLSSAEVFAAAATGKLMAALPVQYPKLVSANGSPYETSGFRLPTDAEQIYLRLLCGHVRMGINSARHFLVFVDPSVREILTWHQYNSDHRTKDIRQAPPLEYQGKTFFDLYGNVAEWCHDPYSEDRDSGTDTLISKAVWPTSKITWGGCYLSRIEKLGTSPEDYNTCEPRIGLRLVRTYVPQ